MISKEALIKSAAVDGERFFVKTRFEKRWNTVCISHFSNRRIGGKDPSSAVGGLFRGSLNSWASRLDIQSRMPYTLLASYFLSHLNNTPKSDSVQEPGFVILGLPLSETAPFNVKYTALYHVRSRLKSGGSACMESSTARQDCRAVSLTGPRSGIRTRCIPAASAA